VAITQAGVIAALLSVVRKELFQCHREPLGVAITPRDSLMHISLPKFSALSDIARKIRL